MAILSNIAWSFSEPIPASPELLVDAVEKYHAEIEYPFDRHTLTDVSPFFRIDLEYEYAVQTPQGEWEYITVVVRVGDGTRPLSFAEILWGLHTMAHEHLRNQDHCYFEGLAPKDEENEPGVPAYEVYLGS